LNQQGDRQAYLKNLKGLADLGLLGINVKSDMKILPKMEESSNGTEKRSTVC